MVGGKYATYVSAAWAPGYLTGAGVGEGESKGKFAVAPLPQWDAGQPGLGQLGRLRVRGDQPGRRQGGGRKVALGLYADADSLTDGWKTQTIFPLNQSVLKSDEFVDAKVRLLRRPDGEQGHLHPGRERLQGRHLQPVRRSTTPSTGRS